MKDNLTHAERLRYTEAIAGLDSLLLFELPLRMMTLGAELAVIRYKAKMAEIERSRKSAQEENEFSEKLVAIYQQHHARQKP